MSSTYTVYRLLFLIGSISLLSGCNSNSVAPQESTASEQPSDPVSSGTFGGSNEDIGKSILEIADGGLLISGTTTSVDGDFSGLGRGNRDVFAIKLTSSGSPSFIFTYGGTNSDWAMDSAEDGLGNLYITGYSRSDDQQFSGQNRGENDLFLMKIAPDGTLIWAKTYGGSNEDYGYALEVINEQLYVAGATRSSNGDVSDKTGDDLDILILKTDLEGELQWVHTFGSSGNDTALGISAATNGRFAVTWTFEQGDGLFDGSAAGIFGTFILELDSGGVVQRSKTISGANTDIGQSIFAANDGGYVIAGQSNSTDGDFSQAASSSKNGFMIKLNNRFETDWVVTTGGGDSDEIHAIYPTDENRWVGVGETRSSDIFSEDPPFIGLNAFAILVEPDGAIAESRFIGGSRSETALDVVSLTSGEMAISGWTLSNDGPFGGPVKAGRDTYLLKISAQNLETIPND